MVRKTILAVGCLLAFALFANAASANRLAVNELRFSASSGALTFASSSGNVICRVTLGGEFHSRTMSKVANSLVGYINSGRAEGCTSSIGGTTSVTVLASTTRPWHITYESFTGRLPVIATITDLIHNAEYLINAGGGLYQCLDSGNVRQISNIESGGRVTSIRPGAENTTTITRLGGFVNCAAGHVEGVFTTITGATTVRLVA
jgi:hypothetical protein